MTARRRFTIGAALFAVLAVVETAGGGFAHSFAVVADGLHNLADALALSAAVLALGLATARDASESMHYGYHRLEVLSALTNGVFLFLIGGAVLLGAALRLGHPGDVRLHTALPLVAGSFAVNLGIALWLRPHGGDLSQRAAYLHILADAGWSAAVLVGLALLALTGQAWLDSAAALVVAAPVLFAAGRVIARSGGILLQKSHLSPAQVTETLRAVPGVLEVPDLRVWHACSYLVVGTAHVVTSATSLEETSRLAREIRALLKDRFGVGLVTLEFESPEGSRLHSHAIESAHPAERAGR